MCELSELSELSPGREVGLGLEERLPGEDMSAYTPRIGDCPLSPGASCALASVSCGVEFPKLSKMLNQEDALGAPCSLREHLLTLRGKEYIAEGVMHPFLILNNLRNPRKDAAESAAFRIRTSTSWLRRHENGSSVPRRAVLSRRRHWFVSFYSHSSTVFQARRETLGIYLQFRAADIWER